MEPDDASTSAPSVSIHHLLLLSNYKGAADISSSSLPMEGEEFPIKTHGAIESIEEEQNKPVSMTSCLMPSRSLRSTVVPAVQVQSHAMADLGFRSLSFPKLFSFRMASSLHASDYIDQLDHSTAAAAASNSFLTNKQDNSNSTKENDEVKKVCRSQSVPTSVKRFKSTKGLRRVADSSSLSPAPAGTFRIRVVPGDTSSVTATATADHEEEDIAAEEALCRICMVALSEEAVLKLECWCKGELALAHRACAIKWFSIKGNGTCDICSQEVLNLPVTLRRLHDLQAQSAQQQQQADPVAIAAATTSGSGPYRSVWQWHGTPILVVVSMLAYFCFLEELLVGDHGMAALAISMPFACVLGLFSSLTTTKMVSRRYVWIYSAVQFLFVVLFTHLFYRYVRTQAVIAIIISTFAGFSLAICTNSVLLQILKWRASYVASTTTGEEGHGSREPSAVDLEIALPPP